ncbi:MAG: hypothetical protein V1835_02590 [Candidatus Micrarchaeota archaeon]
MAGKQSEEREQLEEKIKKEEKSIPYGAWPGLDMRGVSIIKQKGNEHIRAERELAERLAKMDRPQRQIELDRTLVEHMDRLKEHKRILKALNAHLAEIERKKRGGIRSGF